MSKIEIEFESISGSAALIQQIKDSGKFSEIKVKYNNQPMSSGLLSFEVANFFKNRVSVVKDSLSVENCTFANAETIKPDEPSRLMLELDEAQKDVYNDALDNLDLFNDSEHDEFKAKDWIRYAKRELRDALSHPTYSEESYKEVKVAAGWLVYLMARMRAGQVALRKSEKGKGEIA